MPRRNSRYAGSTITFGEVRTAALGMPHSPFKKAHPGIPWVLG